MNTISPSQLIGALHWRYATQKFDPSRKIPAETWHALEQALVLTPSSFGLQPWRFLVIDNPAIRQQLAGASYGQRQAIDASHFVVFAVRKNLGDEHIERHVARTAHVRGVAPESLAGYKTGIIKAIAGARTAGRLDTWQSHQVYIALGQFVAAAAMLGIDTSPMEGISTSKFDEILGLKGTDVATLCACAAGYRAGDDKYATAPKVRFEPDDVIAHV